MSIINTGIESLPNELLIQILGSFQTRPLLNIATVSRRIHDLVFRLLQARLLTAASIKEHRLILECFHPSAKWSTPGLPCEYMGTDGFEDTTEGSGSTYTAVAPSATGRLGALAGLYSHFQPQEAEQTRRRRVPHPAGDVPGHPNTSSSQDHFDTPQIPSQNVHLDSYELFSQLCTIANLVKLGPKAGLFLSCVTIGDGVIRVFRNWLNEQSITPQEADLEKSVGKIGTGEEGMLWLDNGKNVGVRLRVIIRDDLAGPVLQRRDEDPAVSYTLEYSELLIRTTKLLLTVEESLVQETDHTGKAMIIGAWRN